MAKHNQTGKTGEELAAEYLIARGYIIRDINWKNGKHSVVSGRLKQNSRICSISILF